MIVSRTLLSCTPIPLRNHLTFHFFFPPFVAALAGFFAAGLAGFLAFAFAGLASAAGAASASAFGFGSRLGRGAAVLEGFAPPVRISVMRITEKFVAVAALAARILAPALLESDHLVATRVLEHFAGNSCAR